MVLCFICRIMWTGLWEIWTNLRCRSSTTMTGWPLPGGSIYKSKSKMPFATCHLLIKDALARRGCGSRGSSCPRRCKVNSLISSSTISFRKRLGEKWFAGISSSGGTISRRKSWSSTQTTNFLCQRFVSRLGDCPSDKLWNDWNKNWHQAYLGPADPPPLSLLGSRGHHRVHCQVSQLIFRNLQKDIMLGLELCNWSDVL